MPFKHVYVSSACNSSPRCLDWKDDLICFGACNAVLIYCTKECSITYTLISHTKPVNSVKWLKGSKYGELISGSVDHKVILWSKLKNKFLVRQELNGHSAPVTVVNYFVQEDSYWVASASVDSNLLIWKRASGDDDFVFSCKLNFDAGFALDVAFSALPRTKDILCAVARDNSKIHLYSLHENDTIIPKYILRGHEDWVRGVDFTFENSGDLLLASSSQDTYVRLWRIKPKFQDITSDDLSVKLKENFFKVDEIEYSVTLESVLAGHENWVHTVRWLPNKPNEPLKLISASMDKTLIIWEVDQDAGLWLEKVRMGDVGGNTLGFCDVVYNHDGSSILAHGYQGSFHRFNYSKTEGTWEPGVVIRGHFGEVLDIDWDPDGQYLLSCSQDKTTRLHAPWNRLDKVSWHEVARPQIHGYDVTSLTVINRTSFVSGADEKVIRVFAAPRNFVDNFKAITKESICKTEIPSLPEGASVPSLGLSNKAVFQNDLNEVSDPNERHPKDQYPDFYFTPVTLNSPPNEEVLLQNTLWPEIQKLYGHGFEIFCLSCNHQGTLLASACKATKLEYASIIIWDINTWKQLAQLPFHSLTVTQMSFSPNDSYFLTVSRDRTWALYSVKDKSFSRVANSDKKTGIHSRIIWGCAWSCDSKCFATVARDKKMVLWKLNTNMDIVKSVTPIKQTVETEDSATAVAFAPVKTSNDSYIISVGLENGTILVYTWQAESQSDCILRMNLDQSNSHHLTVKRLKFSPKPGRAGFESSEDDNFIQLASCGSDNLVRIYDIDVNKL